MSKPEVPNAASRAAGEQGQTLGILFVHGIGLQQRAETLVGWGDAIVGWLRRWLNFDDALPPDKTTRVEVLDTELGSEDDDFGTPPHARIGFRLGRRMSRRSWLLAESWWAESFEVPRLRDVLYWALVIVPRVTLIHFVPRMRFAMADVRHAQTLGAKERFPYDRRGVWGVLSCLISLPFLSGLTLAIEVAILALAVVSLVPVPVVRDALRSLQTVLAGVIGDSFVFLESPVRQAGTVSRVRRDLAWLATRCDKVVVVAHSQGAAVAHAALERLQWAELLPKEVAGLITLGSGLRKLHDLRHSAKRPVMWGIVAGASAVLSAAFLAALGAWALGSVSPWIALSTMLLCLFALLGPLLMTEALCQQSPPHVGRPWVDYFASHDPVPNGPMLAQGESPREALGLGAPATDTDRHMRAAMERMEDFTASVFRAQPREVVNRQSYLLDHNAYWSSGDDFVARVLLDAARLGDFPLERATADRHWVALAALRRRWRMNLLRWFRWLVGAVVAAVALKHFDVLQPLGGWVTAQLDEWSADRWAEWIPNAPALASAAILAIAWFAAYRSGGAAWQRWQAREQAAFFRRELPVAAGGGWIAFLAAFCLCSAAAGWAWFASPGTLLSEVALWPAAAALLFGLAGGGLLYLAHRRAPASRRDWGILVLAEADRLNRVACEDGREDAEYALSLAQKLLAERGSDAAHEEQIDRPPDFARVLARYGLLKSS